MRVLAEASRSAFEVAQEDIAFIPSSSACGEKVGFVLKSNKILDVEKTFCSPVCRQRTRSCSSSAAQSPPSGRHSACSPCTAEVITDLNWNLSRPDGHDEGGEVVVAPAVASLGAVIIESTQAETWQHHGQL